MNPQEKADEVRLAYDRATDSKATQEDKNRLLLLLAKIYLGMSY